MPQSPLDPTVLHRALRGGRAIRDRVVLLHVVATTLATPDGMASFADTVALLRAVDVRPIVLLDADASADLARRLEAAITQRGERGLLFAAASVVAVQRIETGAAPAFVTMVESVLLDQLMALRYVPVVTLPVLDAAGVASEVSAAEVARMASTFLNVAVLVRVGSDDEAAPTEGAWRTVHVPASALDSLLAAIVLETPAPPAPTPEVAS